MDAEAWKGLKPVNDEDVDQQEDPDEASEDIEALAGRVHAPGTSIASEQAAAANPQPEVTPLPPPPAGTAVVLPIPQEPAEAAEDRSKAG